jgi:hypothetical protein
MGDGIMRHWDFTKFPAWVSIGHVSTLIWGFSNPFWQVILLSSHICTYPPPRSHFHPTSFSFLSTTLPSLQNTKLSHPSLSGHVRIISWHQVQHTPSTNIQRVQHTPKIVCLPFILLITSRPQNVASASGVPSYTIDRHQPALHDSSKLKSPCHICKVISYLTDEDSLSTLHTVHRPPLSTCSNSLDYGLQVPSIMACNLAQSLPSSVSLNSRDYGLQVDLQTCSITASESIAELTRWWFSGTPRHALKHGLEPVQIHRE